MSTSRRKFLRNSFLLTVGGIVGLPAMKIYSNEMLPEELSFNTTGEDTFELPSLPYAYDALEPAIDKMTMEIHHSRHHKAYVDNLNKAVKGMNASEKSLTDLLKTVSTQAKEIRNNGGGHWNHSFFWKIMKPGGASKPEGKLADAIKSQFNSMEEFQSKFNEAAKGRFGSGWAWLVADKNGKLEIGSTPNQDNPLMDVSELKGTPILGIDVWEHAYYLKYQNKRADYISAWWNIVNWEAAMKNYQSVK